MNKDQDIIDCLRLINSPKVGPVTFYKLLETYQTPEEALRQLEKRHDVIPFSKAEAEKELAKARKAGLQLLLYSDKEYPQNLKRLEDAPPVLYVRGNVSCLENPLAVSVVGARNASVSGRKLAAQIAYDLTNNKVTVVSGMARGIDAAAHKGALHAQNRQGPTVAVLGTGADVIYPKENTELYQQICEQGAVISEFPAGTEPQAANFPRRNRIVSALGLGTLVIEATLNSGSLITARLALEQGREVFAVPGFPTDGRAAGPNKLIKEGAALIENAGDILNILCATNRHIINEQLSLDLTQSPSRAKDTGKSTGCEEKTKIIDYLSCDGVYVDEIIRLTGLPPAEVMSELLNLELQGIIERQTGNKVALVK